MKKPFRFILLLFFVALISIGCDSGGGGGDGGNECNGPLLCLTSNWNGANEEFLDTEGNPVIVTSDGEFHSGAVYYVAEDAILAWAGDVTDCYNGILSVVGVDNDLDGIIDVWADSVSGDLNICDETLQITNWFMNGNKIVDYNASYVGPYASSASYISPYALDDSYIEDETAAYERYKSQMMASESASILSELLSE